MSKNGSILCSLYQFGSFGSIWVVVVIKVQILEDKLELVTAHSFSKDRSPIKIIGSLLRIDIRFMSNTHQYTKS